MREIQPWANHNPRVGGSNRSAAIFLCACSQRADSLTPDFLLLSEVFLMACRSRSDYHGQCLNHFHGTTPMKYLPTLAAVCCLIVPSAVFAQQISPNPNPAGNTIKIDDQNAYNSVQFNNQGVIDIRYDGPSSAGGMLTNRSGGLFYNHHNLVVDNQLVNASGGYLWNAPTGTIAKSKWLENHGVLDNDGPTGN